MHVVDTKARPLFSLPFSRPKSRGNIRLRSSDPRDPPHIQPNYLSHEKDLRVAAEAIRLTRKIVQAPALQPFQPQEFFPGKEKQTDEELYEAAGKKGEYCYYQKK